MHHVRVISVCLSLTTLVALAGVGRSDDWPTFRGAQRTSVAVEGNLLKSWPEAGPKLVWETSGAGRGYASVAVAADKIYTLGDGLSTAKDKDEYLSCFDRATGKQLWATKTGPRGKKCSLIGIAREAPRPLIQALIQEWYTLLLPKGSW